MAQNGNEDLEIAQDLYKRLTLKRIVARALDNKYLLKIPSDLTDEFYNALKQKLETNVYTNIPTLQHYKSPRDLASILVAKGDATEAKVQTLFEKQYELEWHTLTGEPDQFSFYGFCKDIDQARAHGNAGGEKVMTLDTRRAHVISRLYHAQQKLLEIRHITYKKLCPPVYVRTKTLITTEIRIKNGEEQLTQHNQLTWTKWKWDNNAFTVPDDGTDVDIEWITNTELRNHITENSKSYDSGNFPNESQLYWAVLEEDDFDNDRTAGENLPFKTQVYVGKASGGIRDRWTASKSHCRKMEFARDVMTGMVSYNPTALRPEQLVDLRFLLHKACNKDGKNSGLFIMRYNGKLDDAETNNIDGKNGQQDIVSESWKPTDMNYGMNGMLFGKK